MYARGASIANRYVFLCKFGPLFSIKGIKKLLFCVKSVTSDEFCGIVLLAQALRKSWTDIRELKQQRF